jgi:FtsP/CotA-like multicopper oxidase with cupredoxin domain
MSRNLPTDSLFQTDHSRRRFVRGLALGGVLAGLIPVVGLAKGLSSFSSAGLRHSPSVLRGTTFDLDISEAPVNFTGKNATGTIINGQIPAPTLYWREGETVTLNVTNRMNVSTSIHWHGMILPADMDGVPGLSYQGIAPGETFQYRFKVQQSGTFWYHSHTRFQEQTGLYGAIVIEPREAERFPSNREHVVVLSDWTDSDPEQVFANLKKMSSYYSRTEPTTPEIFKQAGMDMGNMKGMSNSKTVKIPHHYATEYGPMNTKVTQIASTALDDPGAGLRDNGRRVLSYADLHTIGGPLDLREPTLSSCMQLGECV